MVDEDSDEATFDDVTHDGRPVRTLLADGEDAEYVLRGTVLDTVHGNGDDAERSRTMTADPGGVVTVVTDERVLFVVARRNRTDVTPIPRTDVVGSDVEEMGENRRLTVRTRDGPDYTVYPDDADESTVDEVADALGDDEADGDGGENDDDPLDRLERLADLHDRGALTDAEFESKKRDLLDRI